ncbi:MAG: hypothetical protein HFI67_00025 [Lachnospiraceae bacterium]|jgi:hypothetical protein|nr:hypothetical protein [Lachnospiraceae bacterium]
MQKKVLIIDTSILCVYLKVPFMETCGTDRDKWDYDRVAQKIDDEIRQKSLLVLPLATLIETGNHIAHASGERYILAKELAEIIVKAATAEEPWAAFTSQSELWSEENLKKLANEWPKLAASKISIGDTTIKDVAEFYTESGFKVEILTGDGGLKAYEPKAIKVPRRRR